MAPERPTGPRSPLCAPGLGACIVPLGVGVAVMVGLDWRAVAVIVVAALGYLGWRLWRDRRRRPSEPDLPGPSRRR